MQVRVLLAEISGRAKRFVYLQISPKPTFFIYFVGISNFPGKLQAVPCGLPIAPCESLGCLFPLGGDLRV